MTHAMPILAFDCSTHRASVALQRNGQCTLRSIEHGKQASLLVPTIDGLLNEHRVAYTDLGCIITTVGPGSFTGLRIALATLHGLVLAHAIPIKTLTSLEAVAWDVAQKPDAPRQFRIALDAGKGEVFTQVFTRNGNVPNAQSDIALVAPSSLDTAMPIYGNHVAVDDPYYIAGPCARMLCTIADHLPTTALEHALPLYIRPPDAKIPKPLPWLKEA